MLGGADLGHGGQDLLAHGDEGTGGLEDLLLANGAVGEVLAQRIVDYRTENGPFESINELLNIEDIGESRLEKLLPYITAGGD